MIRVITSLSILLYLLFFISGCAKPPKPRIFWPIDEPKMEWLGNYSSENSFPKSETEKIISSAVGEVASFKFSRPFDVVSDSAGNVFVTDPGQQNILHYDFNKKTVDFLLKPGLTNFPMGITIDSSGQLYVADAQSKHIYVITATGDLIRKFTSTEHLARPSFVVINERLNRIYVSDAKKNHVAVFDLNGGHLFNIGSPGTDEGKFHTPQGIAINADNEIYVADMLNNRVQAFDADGNFIRSFGTIGDQAGDFENPKDLNFDTDGNLHIIDSRKKQLLSYTQDGVFLLEMGGNVTENPYLGMGGPKGMYIDKNDKIFIVDMGVKRFMTFQFLSTRHNTIDPATPEDIQYLKEYLKKQQKK
jgi:DNA-binding beta-propeller fold protein YncE